MVQEIKDRIGPEERSMLTKIFVACCAAMIVWYLQKLDEQLDAERAAMARIQERVDQHLSTANHQDTGRRLRDLETALHGMRIEMQVVRSTTRRIENMLNTPERRQPEVKKGIVYDYPKDA